MNEWAALIVKILRIYRIDLKSKNCFFQRAFFIVLFPSCLCQNLWLFFYSVTMVGRTEEKLHWVKILTFHFEWVENWIRSQQIQWEWIYIVVACVGKHCHFNEMELKISTSGKNIFIDSFRLFNDSLQLLWMMNNPKFPWIIGNQFCMQNSNWAKTKRMNIALDVEYVCCVAKSIHAHQQTVHSTRIHICTPNRLVEHMNCCGHCSVLLLYNHQLDLSVKVQNKLCVYTNERTNKTRSYTLKPNEWWHVNVVGKRANHKTYFNSHS